MRRPLLSLAAALCIAGGSQAQTFTELTSPWPMTGPCPGGGGGFGHRVLVLDFDGDGFQDVAVGEPRSDAVYVFLGPDVGAGAVIGVQPEGFFVGPPSGGDDRFGASLAKGEIDVLPGDELVIGAPKAHGGGGEVHVYSQTTLLRRLRSWRPDVRSFGSGVAVGDFDADGAPDLAVGAGRADVAGVVSAGTVHVFSSLLSAERILPNPAVAQVLAFRGQYGQKLAADDLDGDGYPDLVVTAQGNDQPGQLFAGAVYVHRAPVVAPPGVPVPPPQRLDDPFVVPCDYGPRYGKGVDARDGMVAVSSQRKEPLGWTCPGGLQEDVGAAFLFRGPSLGTVEMVKDVTPQHEGLFGFDVALVDLLGTHDSDLAVASLQDREVHVWAGADTTLAPVVIPLPPGAVYWAFGIDRGDVDSTTPHEELVLGDPRANSCAGRVLVLSM